MARKKADSTAYATTATQAAISGPIQPPAHIKLRECDAPFWEAIIQARAADSWNAADLAHAANLARCQADIVRLQGELEAEGDTIVSARGLPVVNPKHTLVETLSRRAVSLSRALHTHAEATQGRSRDAGNKLGTERAQRVAVTPLSACSAASRTWRSRQSRLSACPPWKTRSAI